MTKAVRFAIGFVFAVMVIVDAFTIYRLDRLEERLRYLDWHEVRLQALEKSSKGAR